MASYVQLGRGFRSSYEVSSFQPRRRRGSGRGLATTLGVAAAVFAAGILMGRLDGGASHARPAGPHPMQFYPR